MSSRSFSSRIARHAKNRDWRDRSDKAASREERGCKPKEEKITRYSPECFAKTNRRLCSFCLQSYPKLCD